MILLSLKVEFLFDNANIVVGVRIKPDEEFQIDIYIKNPNVEGKYSFIFGLVDIKERRFGHEFEFEFQVKMQQSFLTGFGSFGGFGANNQINSVPACNGINNLNGYNGWNNSTNSSCMGTISPNYNWGNPAGTTVPLSNPFNTSNNFNGGGLFSSLPQNNSSSLFGSSFVQPPANNPFWGGKN